LYEEFKLLSQTINRTRRKNKSSFRNGVMPFTEELDTSSVEPEQCASGCSQREQLDSILNWSGFVLKFSPDISTIAEFNRPTIDEMI
jgi:hypothetical protein